MKKFKDNLFITPRPYVVRENKSDGSNQIRTYPLTVKLDNPTSEIIDTKAVFVRGDSNTSMLNVNVTYSGKTFNLTDYIITVNIKEGNSYLETFVCDVTDATNGKIDILIPTNYVDSAGLNIFELSLQKKEQIIISQKYSYVVLDSFGEGYVGDDVEMTTLQYLINEVQRQHDKIQTITNDLNVNSNDIDDVINMIG